MTNGLDVTMFQGLDVTSLQRNLVRTLRSLNVWMRVWLNASMSERLNLQGFEFFLDFEGLATCGLNFICFPVA